MSTNGAILRNGPSGPTGVYHHWDSYPTCLGQNLWRLYIGHFDKNLPRMLTTLIDKHPAGWSTICEKDFSLTPGYGNSSKGYPKHKTGESSADWGKRYRRYLRLKHIARPQCYCHGERHESANPLTLASYDLEWAYVFDIPTSSLSVYNGKDLAGTYDLNGPEPDWAIVECGQNFERCCHVAEKHFPETRDTDSARLHTLTYLGKRPLELHDAVAYKIKGKIWRKGGFGYSSAHHLKGTKNWPIAGWVEELVSKNGRRKEFLISVNRDGKSVPYSGVEPIYPATKKWTIFECGICSCFHPWDFAGDCRDDANRYATPEDFLESKGLKEFNANGQLCLEVRSMEDRVTADGF
jgi:hypothetical protein